MGALVPIWAVFLWLASPSPSFGQETGTWTNLNTTNTPIERHENAFAAVNGKLYLIGGRGVKRVEIYDPATRTWSDGATPPFQMHHFQAVVKDDRIYVVGAYTGTCCDSEYGVDFVYYYNTGNNTWVKSHAVPTNRRRGSAAAVLYNDKIYVVGGIEGGHGAPATGYTWFDEYDPTTGQWKVLPDAPRKRDHYHAVVFNNKLYLIGGRDTSNPAYTSANIGEVDIYNFTTSTWSTLSSSKNLPTVRGGTTSILYHGEILVIGGESSKQTLAHDETEAFDPISESWRTLAPLIVGRHGTQAALFDDAVYIAAGAAQQGGSPELDSIERFESGSTNETFADVVLQPGWNLVGLPLAPADGHYETLYADVALAANQPPMTWGDEEVYVEATDLSIGTSYWLSLDEDSAPGQTQTIAGEPIDAIQIPLEVGWNMIAGPSCSDVVLRGASTNPVAAVPTGVLYRFEGSYVPAYSTSFPRGTLDQGVGYWVMAEKAALLSLDCGASKQSEEEPAPSEDLSGFHRIAIADDGGRAQALYFGGSFAPGTSPVSFQLPPRVNRSAFDVRLAGDLRATEAASSIVRVQTDRWPLSVTITPPGGRSETRYSVEALLFGEPSASYTLGAGENLSLTLAEAQSLRIRALDGPETPLSSTLQIESVYPNPFRDRATIRYTLTESSRVHIDVFDTLGRRFYSVEETAAAGAGIDRVLDTSAWPAGVYVYRIEATSSRGIAHQSGRLILTR
jgi:hypothetical protein